MRSQKMLWKAHRLRDAFPTATAETMQIVRLEDIFRGYVNFQIARSGCRADCRVVAVRGSQFPPSHVNTAYLHAS